MTSPQQHARPRPRRRKASTLPRLVLHYNRWTGFESKVIAAQFRRMTAAEVEAIAVGDEVWVSRDPIHPNGKVYGYARERITGVAYLEERGETRLHFSGGCTTVAERSTHPCYVVKSPSTLARLVVANPLCTQVSAY